jgi:hypothetical protein
MEGRVELEQNEENGNGSLGLSAITAPEILK